MAKKKVTATFTKTKKQLKEELAGKIASALPEIKISLGEKKFTKRVKKVTKLLTQGLHLNSTHKKTNKKAFSTNGVISNNTVAEVATV